MAGVTIEVREFLATAVRQASGPDDEREIAGSTRHHSIKSSVSSGVIAGLYHQTWPVEVEGLTHQNGRP